MRELELKAVVPDAEAVRARLVERGAERRFAGRLRDRRFDRDGQLGIADEVLRVRRFESVDGTAREELGWKGPTTVAEGGYKSREELETRTEGGVAVETILRALRFDVVHAIDRHVEYYAIEGATVRLEWYPDADTLVEVEGEGPAIEAAIAATGLPRDGFSADTLAAFAERFAAREGRPARLSLQSDHERPAHWPAS